MPVLKIFTRALVLCLLLASQAHADLLYDPRHDTWTSDLQPVSSIRHTLQYNCDNSSLVLSVSAAADAVNGRKAAVDALYTSVNGHFDVSAEFTLALDTKDFIERGLRVQCSPEHGTIRLEFTGPTSDSAATNGKTISELTIFPDGLVSGSRSTLP